ncbi:MAG: efflux RND transporter permease subunit, partial [Deltaproteobacteria bacterium]|nr:efflux RND transporter permease subunit [Deltaproteobacteria bacterium]
LDGLPLGEAMKKVREASSRLEMAPGYRVVFSGEGDTMTESFGYMGEALLLAVIFVYLVLAAQFESFIDPLAIMLSLPLSIVGMAGMLFLTGDTINIMSLIGLILLMGLVTKNAILLVDYAKVLQGRGMGRTEAVIAAGRTRLRPIMMTTLAMIFGMIPLALALGAGAEMRAPMARAVIGGLITSTMLTLLVVPVVYTLFDDFGNWARRKWEGKPVAAAAGLLLVLCSGAAAFAPSAACAGGAGGVESFTLEEALRAALGNNRQIRSAVEERTRLTGRYVEERAAALPQLVGKAGAQRTSDGTMAIVPGAEISDRQVAELSLSQPLYAGGAVSAGIRAAKSDLASAEDRIRSARQNALREVHAAFHDVLLARELFRIALQNRDQRARHLDEAKKKFLAGTATDYDVLVAEVALQNSRPDVLRTENLIRTSRERLRFLIGKGEREVDARGVLSADVGEFPDHEKSLAVALENRPELSGLRHRRETASELVTVARSGYLPRLNFQGAFGYQDLDFNAFDYEGKIWTVGVFASWNLFDGFRTRGQVAQARSDEASLRIEEARLLDAIALEVRDAVNAVRESGE